jgi:hypothetical protein
MPLKLLVETGAIVACGIVAVVGTRVPDLRRFQRFLEGIARHRALVCVAAALAVLLVRAALLPIWPIPRPSIYDEFSYILQADTFAHGRLANPPHPLWQFFETVYVLQQPTYASKYPPGQGLVMAAGQRLLGQPWFGIWLSCGALAAALCWGLQGWLSAGWALLGTVIAVDSCAFSYWMNSYWGGAVAAIGGALVVGAYARLRLRGSAKGAWMFGLGSVILLLTRPYEGALLIVPAAVFLWLRRKQARVWVPIVIVSLAGLAWDAFYNYRVTGHPLRMPYQEYFSQYESAPPWIVLPAQPAKFFRHFDLEFLDEGWTRAQNDKARGPGLIPMRASDLYQTAKSVFGDPLWLLPLIVFAPEWLKSKRTRLLSVLIATLAAGAAIEMIFYPHYAAPFTVVLLILLVQSLRAMRFWAAHNLRRGAAGYFLCAAFCGVLVGVTWGSEASRIYRRQTPDRIQAANARKSQIEADLRARHPGRHVIFVRYTGTKSPHAEWIYNLADIDSQPVIWAQDMGVENSKLIAYYPGRIFWLFQPDEDSHTLLPYP